MKIIVIGAGAWGTALAISAARNHRNIHDVTLWARDSALVHSMAERSVNTRYLPTCVLPQALKLSAAPLPTLLRPGTADAADLVIVATPMLALRAMLENLSVVTCPVAWVCKGFESSQCGELGLLGHEIQQQCVPAMRAGVVSGPSFAQEVGSGMPTALVAASVHATVRETMVSALHSAELRVYASDDVVGVEVGGAVKNVLAIATGLCDGLHLGLNARAALITRGLAEIGRLGMALGARPETFMGLSGLGDLVLTATGDLSRNRKVGLALAHGKTLEHAVAELGHVAEGVYSARTVLQRARSVGIAMPITQCVVDLLDGKLLVHQAMTALMERDPTAEVY